MAFCKTLLDRLPKMHVGAKVTSLLESFQKNNLSNLDIIIFKELLEKHFKVHNVFIISYSLHGYI